MTTETNTKTTSKLHPNDLQLRIQGRIDKVDRFDGQNGTIHEALVILPAPDQYTSPPRFQVKSSRLIGKAGEAVDITVVIRSRYFKAQSGKVHYTPEMWWDDAA